MRFMIVAVVLGGLCLVSSRNSAADGSDHATDIPHGDRPMKMLRAFPLDAFAYQPHVAELVKAGVPERFGHEEWTAIVLTNEFHQHVGIYTVLGAKMGVLAREALNAPMRAVNVTVETGDRPPMSCVIDGLQVALGSTFAQNLIHAPATAEPRVAAVFEYKGRKLRLALKPEFQKRIADYIAEAIRDCGDLTPAYFERIEAFSYRVWTEFDRHTIFAVDPISPAP